MASFHLHNTFTIAQTCKHFSLTFLYIGSKFELSQRSKNGPFTSSTPGALCAIHWPTYFKWAIFFGFDMLGARRCWLQLRRCQCFNEAFHAKLGQAALFTNKHYLRWRRLRSKLKADDRLLASRILDWEHTSLSHLCSLQSIPSRNRCFWTSETPGVSARL